MRITENLTGVMHPDMLAHEGLYLLAKNTGEKILAAAEVYGTVLEQDGGVFATISTEQDAALRASLDVSGSFHPYNVSLHPRQEQIKETIHLSGFFSGRPATVELNRYGPRNGCLVKYTGFGRVEDSGKITFDFSHGLVVNFAVDIIIRRKMEALTDMNPTPRRAILPSESPPTS